MPVFLKSEMTRALRLVAGICGAMAVAAGAAAAHAIADPHAAAMVEKASSYQLLHALALLYLANETGRAATFARLAFLMGIVFFSGGIYLHYFSNILFLKDFIPFGGICYIAGWLGVAALGFDKTATSGVFRN